MKNLQKAVLIVEAGVASTTPLFIDNESQIIGSSNDADILMENPFISRKHCKVQRIGDSFNICDLGSTNGSSVNGTAIEPHVSHDLNDRDLITLGHSVQIRFLIQSSGKTMTLTKTMKIGKSDLTIDLETRQVHYKGSEINPPFTPKEFSLLALLYDRRQTVVSKDEISVEVWPERLDGSVSDEEIGQCVRRIRRKLGDSSLIKTYRGVGYQLV